MNSPFPLEEKTKTSHSPFLLREEEDGSYVSYINPDYKFDMRKFLIHFCGYSVVDAGFTTIIEEEALRQAVNKVSVENWNEFFDIALASMECMAADDIVFFISSWLEITNNRFINRT